MYAIQVLEKEKELIDRCLSESDWKTYPEARKRQLKKSKELELAINLLKN